MIIAVFDLVCINCSFFYIYIRCFITSFEYTYFVILYVITAFFEKRKAGASSAYTYVCKVIGDSGTVALSTMGECRGTPTSVELLWIGQICVPTSGLSACGVSLFFGRAFLYKLK